MKMLVVVPVHAPWHVAELTIGTFLRSHAGNEIDLHIGVHLNFCDYTKDHRMFEDLRGLAQIHMVPEINWEQHGESVFRYSTMHARNLQNLLHHAAYYTFDRLVILDHDLLVKGPFVTELSSRYKSADLIGAAFAPPHRLMEFNTDLGQPMYALPKISVWHTIMTRKVFDRIMEDPNVIYPRILSDADKDEYRGIYNADKNLPVFVDTFADVLHKTRHKWGLEAALVDESEFAEWVRHYSGSSFNYGFRLLGPERYTGRMEESLALFGKEFPDGLAPLKKAVGKVRRRRNGDSRNKGPHDRSDVGASV